MDEDCLSMESNHGNQLLKWLLSNLFCMLRSWALGKTIIYGNVSLNFPSQEYNTCTHQLDKRQYSSDIRVEAQ